MDSGLHHKSPMKTLALLILLIGGVSFVAPLEPAHALPKCLQVLFDVFTGSSARKNNDEFAIFNELASLETPVAQLIQMRPKGGYADFSNRVSGYYPNREIEGADDLKVGEYLVNAQFEVEQTRNGKKRYLVLYFYTTLHSPNAVEQRNSPYSHWIYWESSASSVNLTDEQILKAFQLTYGESPVDKALEIYDQISQDDEGRSRARQWSDEAMNFSNDDLLNAIVSGRDLMKVLEGQ